MDKNQTGKQQTGADGVGRTNNTGNPKEEAQHTPGERRDISHIDQQEGAMNHGETGDLGSTAGAGGSSNPDE